MTNIVTLTVNWLHLTGVVVAPPYSGEHLEGGVATISVPVIDGHTPTGATPYVISPVPSADTQYDYYFTVDLPTINVTTDKSRIGVNGKATATITSNMHCTKFEARATKAGAPKGRGIGIDVLADDVTVDAAGVHTLQAPVKTWQFDVEHAELIQDGDYVITVYARNLEGEWGDGELYIHIKYSADQPTSNNDLTSTPSAWMGVHTGQTDTPPLDYTLYAWYKIKGDTGADGQTAYEAAQAGGYSGTQSAFYADLAAMEGLAAELAAI